MPNEKPGDERPFASPVIHHPDGPHHLYQRISRHERSLWVTTVAVVVMSAVTIAILTVTSAMYGSFSHASVAYLLAGGSLLLLGLFIAHVVMQRRTLEDNRVRIFRELESRSGQLQEANRSLKEALRTQDTFLNTVSHELKTPLTCVIGYAEYLAEEELEEEEVRGHARTILDEGRSLMRLIEQMVDVTRFRSGTVSLDRDRIDLNRLLAQVVEDIERDLHGAGSPRRAGVQYHYEPLPVRLDATRMRMVFDALVRNALTTSDAGTNVSLRTAQVDAEWAEVLLEDDERHLSDEEREAIFRPFGQLDAVPDGRSGDLGLALPLLKRYVMAHGGLLQINEGKGPGLVVRIQLPLDFEAEGHDEGSGDDLDDEALLKRAS